MDGWDWDGLDLRVGGGIEHITVLIRIKLTAGLDPKFLTVLDLYLYQKVGGMCQYVNSVNSVNMLLSMWQQWIHSTV